MEHINQFSKGINKDASDIFQPKDTAKNLKHWVQISEDGDTYSISNENGVTDTLCNIPLGFKIIGYTVLNTEILVVLAHTSGYSQIGYIDYDNVYHRVVPSTDTGSQLGFTIDHPVDCVAKKTYSGDRILYYTDNNVPFGFINLDNPPEDSDIKSNTKLIPDINSPIILPISFGDGGVLFCGSYQFSLRYIKEDLSSTIISGTTNVIPVIDEAESAIMSERDGGDPSKQVNKSLLFKLYNIDTSYPQFQILVHRVSNSGNVTETISMPPVTITNSTMNYTFTGVQDDYERITLEEVREPLITYNTAKCIEQIDNRLILGNLKEASPNRFTELQNIANNIKVKYKIREELYDSKSDTVVDTFGLLAGFRFENSTNISKFIFSNRVDTNTAKSVFKLYESTTLSTGSIIVNNVTGFPTNTITVDTVTFTFTSTDTGNPLDIYINASGTTDEAAESIYNKLSVNTTLTSKFNISFIDSSISIGYIYPGNDSFTLSWTGSTELTLSGISGGDIPTEYQADTINIDNYTCTLKFSSSVDFTSSNLYFFEIDTIHQENSTSTYSTTNYVPLGYFEPDFGTINNILYNNPAGTYKDEFSTTFLKGYKRNEVYSFALKVQFKDGTDSYCYHIPGSNFTATSTQQAIPDSPGTIVGNTTGTLGTYISTIEYPLNQGLPGTRVGDTTVIGGNTVSNSNIRHHKLPDLTQEPHFRSSRSLTGTVTVNGIDFNTYSTEVYIRILGLEFEFAVPFSTDIIDNIQNFSIVRESREKIGNKSIISQGIGIPMYAQYTKYKTNGDRIDSSLQYSNQPFFDIFNMNISAKDDIVYEKESINTLNHISYYSPDIILGNIIDDDLENNTVSAKLKVSGEIQDLLNTNTEDINNLWKPRKLEYQGEIDHAVVGNYHTVRLNHKEYASLWSGCYYNQITTISSTPNTDDSCQIEISKTIPYNVEIDIGTDKSIYNAQSGEFTVLKTTGGTYGAINTGTLGNTVTISIDSKFYFDRALSDYGDFGKVHLEERYGSDSYTLDMSASVNILEIENNINNQYGELDNSEYLEIYRSINIPSIPGTISNVYGGDTFISNFSTTNKNIIPYVPGRGKWTAFQSLIPIPPLLTPPPWNPNNESNWTHHDPESYSHSGSGAVDREPDPQGLNTGCIYMTILESTINCDFRHQYQDPDTGGFTTKYYPKSTYYETLKVKIENLCKSYNLQYSQENAIKTYFSKSLSGNIEGEFSNRFIYSDNAALDSINDNYRQFPVNNYQDIPKHTGEIWDLFVTRDVLFAHTPKSLWKLFSKGHSVMQTNDISEVILGTGGSFELDPKQNSSFKGGYAGSISQFAGTHTPAGYIFPDVLQGKIFLFNGEGLQELSRSGLLREFNNNLSTGLISVSGYIDNPYTGNGILGTYDFDLKRYLISKKGYTTYSYSFINNCWFSQHDYIPDLYVSINNKLYMIDNTNQKFYEANTGNKGDFKTLLPSIVSSDIEFIVNPSTDYTKVFDNMIFNTNSYDSNGVYLPYDTFNTFSISNDLQSVNNLNIEVNNEYSFPDYSKIIAKFKNNEYRISLPRSNNDDRIKSKYAKINLKYNNTSNNHFIVNFIKTLFRINKR